MLAIDGVAIPGAEATEIPQGQIRRDAAAQGHIRYTKPDGNHKPNGNRPRPPVVVIPQPIYLVAPQRCVVPGYWNYAWVPQSYVTNGGVPASYHYDAVWIEPHYEPRTYTWGYYQPYWVPERAC